MKKVHLSALLCMLSMAVLGQQWQPAGSRIQTPWSGQVSVQRPLPEYPRPQLVRPRWQNLNGLWSYAISPAAATAMPPAEGQLLVPFCVESSLSGVGRNVGPDSLLWYRTRFTAPPHGGTLLLHFGAVDWRTDVWLNGRWVGRHEGGYDPFSFDIAPFLHKKGPQELTLKVWDPTNAGPQPRGKQVARPHGIWYTPVTGIWQTVWLEPLPAAYLASLKNTPDLDSQSIHFQADVKNYQPDDELEIIVFSEEREVSRQRADPASLISIPLPNARLWWPESPHLYRTTLRLLRKGQVIDEARSYFGMRKSHLMTDENGLQRMALNGRILFQYGPLDQGWWPDGLYTAPTEAALRYDIEQTLAMGFNLIRKHVKVEPARWYAHCDSLGVLVWQDMPSGDREGPWGPDISHDYTELVRTPASQAIYRRELRALLDAFQPFPSIVCWVPFNEGWGQYHTAEVTGWVKGYDPSRLVNSASGGNFLSVGDIVDIHHYPEPRMPSRGLFGKNFALVLGEFGGLGLPVEGHTWATKANWGYQTFKNADELTRRYEGFMKELKTMQQKGLSAAVYTQTTDVEVETNGLMSYDRRVLKIPAERLKALHEPLYK